MLFDEATSVLALHALHAEAVGVHPVRGVAERAPGTPVRPRRATVAPLPLRRQRERQSRLVLAVVAPRAAGRADAVPRQGTLLPDGHGGVADARR